MTFTGMKDGDEKQNSIQTTERTESINTKPLNSLEKSPSLLDLWDASPEYQQKLAISKQIESSRAAKDPLPLNNLGNTCYINSTMQSLCALAFFIDDLIKKFEVVLNDKNRKEDCKFEMTRRLVRFCSKYTYLKGEKVLKGDEIDSQLKKLKKTVADKNSQFNSSMQQDAVEFMQIMLSTIEDEFDKVKNIIPFEENPIRKCFAIEFDSVLNCIKCEHSLKLQKETMYAMYLCIPVEAKNDSFSLQDAVDYYFKPEKTEHKCEKCGSTEKMRYMHVSKLPTVLFLQLGRYAEDGTKKHEVVHVPSELHVPSVRSNSPNQQQYKHKVDCNLVATVSHFGSTLISGHYVCYVFQNETNSWYICDDDVITKTSLESTQEGTKNSGYCFFYVNKSS